MTEKTEKYCWIFTALVLLNFIAFVIIALSLGGDAVNGKIIGTQFFLGSGGRYTAVSEWIFYYSLVHTCSVISGHLTVFMLLLFNEVLNLQGRFDRKDKK